MEIGLPLERLTRHLVDGAESFKVELKWNLRIDRANRKGRTVPDKEGRKEFAKDVAALANSPAEANDQRGFMLLGVKDRKHHGREGALPLAFSPFGSLHEVDAFGGRLQRIVSNYLDPPPEVHYCEVRIPGKVEPTGIIVVMPPSSYPLVFTKNMAAAQENDVAWVRRSPQDPYRDRLTRREVEHIQRSYDDAGVQNLRRQIEVLREGVAALTGQLAGAETWKQAKAEPIPGSLAGFVSLDESERESAVRSVRLAGNLDEAQQQLYAQVLMGMLRDQSYVVVWEAVRSLCHVDTSLAIEALLEVCRTREDEIVYQALEALGQLGDGDTMLALEELKALGEELPVLRQADEEKQSSFLQAVDEATFVISEKLEPSPDTYAEYVLKE